MKFQLTPQEARQRWIESLRQPGLRKCHGGFTDGRGAYCVCGMACETFIRFEDFTGLIRVRRGTSNDARSFGYREPFGHPCYEELPDVVSRWLGMRKSDDYRQFLVLNDHTDMTLAEIADEVERWSNKCLKSHTKN